MEIGLKSLILVAAALIFVLFSFLPTWQLFGNFPSQLAVAAPAPSAQVGTISGEFAVNGNGGATYTIPIEVPPGTNGVQPNLSLVYNSQQGNGLLGVGWELAGLSAISRCGKTIATDGVKGGVDFNNDDRFCFDGQRLMAVSGNYGADGTEYRTERETWVRVISHGSQNGPRSFTVTTKDGHQMEFGNTDDSRILARGRSDGAVRVWALNRISDRNGNFVDVSYQEDPSRVRRSISGAFLGYYPTEIRYTGNSGVTPRRLVKFEYENRNDNITAYVGGSEAETTKRLAGIKTYVDLDGDGNSIETANNLVKEYRLAYEYGTATGRSRLTQLEECDAVGVCLLATQFEWQDRSGGDWNNPFNRVTPEGTQYQYNLKSDPGATIIPGDYNGDGMMDFIGQEHGGWDDDEINTFNVYFSQGNGYFNRVTPEGTQYQNDLKSDPGATIIPGDYNGDGMMDFIGQEHGGWDDDEINTFNVYFSQGNGYFNRVTPEGTQYQNDLKSDPGATIIPGDYNGDGMMDFIRQEHGGWDDDENETFDVYFSQGNGYFNRVTPSGDEYQYNLKSDPGATIIPGDYNGDGMMDFIRQEHGGWDNDENETFDVYFSKPPIPDLLTTITNGLGGETQIEYKPLTDSTVYTKEVTETENNGTANSANGLGSTDVVVRGNISSSSDEDWFAFDIPSSREIQISVASDNNQNLDWYLYQESNLSQPVKQGNSTNNPEEGTYNATNPGRYYLKVNGYNGATSPYTLTLHSSNTIVRVQNSMYVVSQHTIKDKATNPTNTFIYDHKYEGAKVDRHRGWLGFEKTILIDNQNQTKTITTHHTDFPLLGMMDDREIWDIEHEGNLLGKMASSYESSPKDSNGIYKFWKTAVALEHYTEGIYNYTLKRTYQ